MGVATLSYRTKRVSMMACLQRIKRKNEMFNYIYGMITSTYVYSMVWLIDDTAFSRLFEHVQSALP